MRILNPFKIPDKYLAASPKRLAELYAKKPRKKTLRLIYSGLVTDFLNLTTANNSETDDLIFKDFLEIYNRSRILHKILETKGYKVSEFAFSQTFKYYYETLFNRLEVFAIVKHSYRGGAFKLRPKPLETVRLGKKKRRQNSDRGGVRSALLKFRYYFDVKVLDKIKLRVSVIRQDLRILFRKIVNKVS